MQQENVNDTHGPIPLSYHDPHHGGCALGVEGDDGGVELHICLGSLGQACDRLRRQIRHQLLLLLSLLVVLVRGGGGGGSRSRGRR